MSPANIEKLAEQLCHGTLTRAQSWEMAAAVDLIAVEMLRSDSSIGLTEVRAAAGVLNAYRYFEHTVQLAGMWTHRGRPVDLRINRLHAQAAINLGALKEAEDRVALGLALTAGSGVGEQEAARERIEYLGLRARILKQRALASDDLDELAAAVEAYWQPYRTDVSQRRSLWHGVNALALGCRLQLRGGTLPAGLDVEALGRELSEQAIASLRADPHNPWPIAILSEAQLALNQCDSAELWLYRLLHHPGITPFVLDSYDRQLREIWEGSALASSTRCADLLAGIMARYMMQTESRVTFAAPDIEAMRDQLARDTTGFERNFSGERGISLATLREMLRACESIGCVTNHLGERLGTGFLVKGSALVPEWGEGPVFVTNAHVLSDIVAGAIPLAEARVTFEVESASAKMPVFRQVGDLLFTSPPGELGAMKVDPDRLDATVVRLPDLGATAGLKVSSALPRLTKLSRAYVVGHPRGGGLQLSMHDSQLLDIDDAERLLHYRTPTDPGNSGSPVFNTAWEVMALHHGGSSSTPWLHGNGIYEANEGISLAAIAASARANLAGSGRRLD